MIHEEICTYEVCKLAKDKGFNGSGCFKHYDQNGLLRSNRSFSRFDLTIAELYKHDTPSEVQAYAPTQSLLQRWLREEKNIHIEIVATACGYMWIADKTNGTGISDSDILDRGTNDGGCFDTFELALEDVLKYALEDLVI